MADGLSHVAVSHLGEAPEGWLLFLHGILGSKSNWRSLARRMIAQRPSTGALLVDLRMHGNSQGFAPPHTIEAAARDLLALEPKLGAPVRGVLGHSLGGKVALEVLRQRPAGISDVWVIDSVPSARPTMRGAEGTKLVIQLLRSLGPRFATREAFVAEIEAHGLGRDLAAFLAMNLERGPDGFVLALDLDALDALLDDYFARDVWDVVEAPPGEARVHLVVGGRSPLFDEADLARARAAAAARPDRVDLTVLPAAGHWVHVDDPDGLLALIVAALPA